MAVTLNEEWSRLFEAYKLDHQDPRNQACHSIGIPLILASIPASLSIVGLPLGVGLFTVGWGFQFAGHAFEGKKPSFVDDKRSLLIGALWWLKSVGLDVRLAGQTG